MRILLVNGYATNSKRGHEKYESFKRHVLRTIKELEKTEVTQVHVIEKDKSELDEFLFELHSPYADPLAINRFDQLDFIFVDGDINTCPWSISMQKLFLLTKMCTMTGKCLFASGLGGVLLAYVCSTGGEHFQVINNEGKGEPIDSIQTFAPPPPPLKLRNYSSSSSTRCQVILDTKTGDFYTFDSRKRLWNPKGNTGVILHFGHKEKDYGAKINMARGGTKTIHKRALTQDLYISKRGETKCCCRLEFMNHPYFKNLGTREFLVDCKSKWDLDEEIVATGTNKYKVLIDSNRSPMLIEFSNALGMHFTLSKEYPETLKLLRNFVFTKYEDIKVHAHVDRSFMTAVGGPTAVVGRLNLTQAKTIHTTAATAASTTTNASSAFNDRKNNSKPPEIATMHTGRTSPRRCRPVSAGPVRNTQKNNTSALRTIHTSRSAFPSTTTMAMAQMQTDEYDEFIQDDPYDNDDLDQEIPRVSSSFFKMNVSNFQPQVDPQMVKSHQQQPNQGLKSPPSGTSTIHSLETSQQQKRPSNAGTDDRIFIENQDTETSQQFPHPPTVRVVRVPQKGDQKPFCSVNKFNKMCEIEKTQNSTGYYSVVNDAPYISSSEREALEHQKSKLKWMGGPFLTAFGKASSSLRQEASIFARGPYDAHNTPFYIFQRR